MPSLWHGSRVRLGVGAEWALMVALVAIQGKGPVLDTVEDAREPAVMPVNRGRERRVAFGVGGVPCQPKRGELFHDLRVVGPALGYALREWVSVSNPGDPLGELPPELLR